MIRDILHRIRDRWPCHVIVWPVVVQGEQAAAQVIAAIEGFNALAADGPIARPDVLIVARGGGSVEDLWGFNDEALARAAAASAIPLISAVGHETDTTLIDFVSDRRAPTPTAAAEIATPVLAELKALIADHQKRLVRGGERTLDQGRTRLAAAARGLPRPQELLATPSQRFDLAAGRLGAGLERNVAVHERRLAGWASRLNRGLLDRPRTQHARRLADLSARMKPAVLRHSARAGERLANLDKLLDVAGPPQAAQAGARAGDACGRQAGDDGRVPGVGRRGQPGVRRRRARGGGRRDALRPPPAPPPAAAPRKAAKPVKTAPGQGDLF